MYNYKIFPLEWDENKNKANIEKHGLTFDDAELVFSGITKTVVDDRYNYGEIRHITFGMLASRAVVIAHTQREERIRIISMRKANEREKKYYQK